MRLLHTSDWHLGSSLMGHKRYSEHSLFLSWLIKSIQEEHIDVLLLCGDVFDSALPGSKAQELYYNFLCQLKNTGCRHIVTIAGNHDSHSFLNAPGELLRHLGIYVVGNMTNDPAEEVVSLKDSEGRTELIVCAVPYLRERDIRSVEAYESPEQKEQKLLAGITKHYQDVFNSASMLQKVDEQHPPIVALGHLFAAGGRLHEGEAVRELYIGNLLYVPSELFPAELAYVALGHLHAQQEIGGKDNLRYSGSPIPLSFGEAEHEKQVLIVDITDSETKVTPLLIPQSNKLKRISGDWNKIAQELHDLRDQEEAAWLEVCYTGDDILPSLMEDIEALLIDSKIELLRLKNDRLVGRALSAETLRESLDDLSTDEVFTRCLQKHKIDNAQTTDLWACYREIMQMLSESDPNIEEET